MIQGPNQSETYADLQFSGNTSINSLIEDLKVESLARNGWKDLLNVRTATGKVLSILESSTVILELEMKNARLNRSPAEYNNSKSMFVATWRSIMSKSKRAMVWHKQELANDGPIFLY